jgi:hypothetical protein
MYTKLAYTYMYRVVIFLFGSVQKIIDIFSRFLWRIQTKLQQFQLALLAGVGIESRSPKCEIHLCVEEYSHLRCKAL